MKEETIEDLRKAADKWQRENSLLRKRFALLKYHADCMCAGINAGYESATEHAYDYRADFPE